MPQWDTNHPPLGKALHQSSALACRDWLVAATKVFFFSLEIKWLKGEKIKKNQQNNQIKNKQASKQTKHTQNLEL